MKRTLKYALTAVLGIGLVAPAFAQTDNFPDVPENHWAYEALARLKKDGLLVGYPDGLFRGTRPASRYELAVAIHAVYTNLRNVTDGLQSQIDALKNNSDLQALKDQVAALQSQVNMLKGYGEDIANLKKLADTFQTELHALGVDVDQLKKDLGDLARRVTALEAKKPAVDISGDASFFLLAGQDNNGVPGVSTDGRLEGILKTKTGGFAAANGRLDTDVSILHEIAMTFAGTNTTGPQWKGTIVYGNALSSLGNESTTTDAFGASAVNSPAIGALAGSNATPYKVGTPYTDTGTEGFYVQDFSVKFNTSLIGLGLNAEVGRIGYKVGPYLLQRVNPNSYFTNSRWDNGEYYFDGAKVAFNLLGGKIDIFGGRTSNQFSSDGIDLNPLQSGGYGGPLSTQLLGIDRTLGVDVSAPITSAGNLKVAYIWLGSNPGTTPGVATATYPGFGAASAPADQLGVYGGTLDFALGVIKLEGNYSKSVLKDHNTTVNDQDADMYQGKISYGNSKFGLYGFYRGIGANFMAPGDWGRIGLLVNPTNIVGETVGGHLNLTPGLILKADYEHERTKTSGYGATSGFDSGTKLDKYDISLGYKFSSTVDLSVGYEDDKFTGLPGSFGAAGDPHYKWTTFGIGYGLSDAAKLTLQYQLSDVDNEFVLPTVGQPGAMTHYKGGLLSSQLTIKF
jgi:polyhydroxyalkanoate synthesis regulator phasin